MKMIDESGKKYGLLDVLAIDYTPIAKRRGMRVGARFLCQCSCGMVVTVPGVRLRQRPADITCGCVMGRLPSEELRVLPESVAYLNDMGLLKRALAKTQVYRNGAESETAVVPDTVDALLSTNMARSQFFTVLDGETVTLSLIINRKESDVRIVLLTNKV